jgi:hypothetical protein
MNKRIRELAEQANEYAAEYEFENGGDEFVIFKEKFAELIVLESSKWIVDNSVAMEHLGPEFFAMGLCKHFGIK